LHTEYRIEKFGRAFLGVVAGFRFLAVSTGLSVRGNSVTCQGWQADLSV